MLLFEKLQQNCRNFSNSICPLNHILRSPVINYLNLLFLLNLKLMAYFVQNNFKKKMARAITPCSSTIFRKRISMMKNLEKGQRLPSPHEVAAGSSRSVSNGIGCGRQRSQDHGDNLAVGAAAEQAMIQPNEHGFEEEGAGNCAGLHELEALLKQIEALKNKMRDLFERIHEKESHD